MFEVTASVCKTVIVTNINRILCYAHSVDGNLH